MAVPNLPKTVTFGGFDKKRCADACRRSEPKYSGASE